MKNNSLKRFLAGTVLMATMLTSNAALAANETIGVSLEYEVNKDGSSVVTLKGDYDEVLPAYRREMTGLLSERRLCGAVIKLDLNSNKATAYVISTPSGVEGTVVNKCIVLKGNLDEVDQKMALRPNWEVLKYEGSGTIDAPYGEAVMNIEIK